MDEKILSLQQPSTRNGLLRPESEDIDWQMRGWPTEWQAVPHARTDEERVGARAISYAEAKIEQGLRYNRGAILAQMRKEPMPSSITPEKKSMAENAFMFVRVKFKDLMKWSGLATEKDIAMVKREE